MRRRDFLSKAVAVSTVPATLSTTRSIAQQASPNSEVRVALIGCGSRGPQLLKDMAQVPGAKLVAACDADPARAHAVATKNGGVPVETDYRKLLDRNDVDAVLIATPNHSHVLIAAAACMAGKDVYVEKPVSHCIREGRILTEIARKTKRVVQVGLQNSSDKGLFPARDFFQAGTLGQLKAVHTFWFKSRAPIGKVSSPTPVDPSIDYSLFRGPRALIPLRRKNLHYDWHWSWDTGNGEFGNTLVHNIDHTRILLGLKGHATHVRSVGGRLAWDDDGETPNTFLASLRYPGLDVPFTCEIRNLPYSPEKADVDSRFMKKTVGTFLLCENGVIFFNRGGGYAADASGKEIQRFPGDGGGTHVANFIDAVRARDTSLLRRDIEEGHISSSACHLANISHLTGTTGHTLDSIEKEAPEEFLAAKEAWTDFKQHIAIHQIDMAKSPLTLGAALQFDGASERFLENSDHGRMANYLIEDIYRAPFTLPPI